MKMKPPRARLVLLTLAAASSKSNNDYYLGADRDEVIGAWGGTCTCPDGEIFFVGDLLDACKTIACVGGVSGECVPNIPALARGRGVVCEGATPAPTTPRPTLSPPPDDLLLWFDGCDQCGNQISGAPRRRRDEFDGDSLDATKWSVEEWPARTFNDELQRYTTGTVTVKDGVLAITASNSTETNVVSGRITTFGKFKFTFWLLGADFATTPWPGCGEIDVLEKMGRLNYHMACACTHNAAHNFVYGPDNPPLAYGCRVLDDLKANASESGWHVWALDWSPSKLSVFVDSVEIFAYAKPPGASEREWPYYKPQFLIANLAICGNAFWQECGDLEDSGLLLGGVQFLVDYVRIYKYPGYDAWTNEGWFEPAPLVLSPEPTAPWWALFSSESPAATASWALPLCANQTVGCTIHFSATTRPCWLERVVKATPPRHRAGVASMAWRARFGSGGDALRQFDSCTGSSSPRRSWAFSSGFVHGAAARPTRRRTTPRRTARTSIIVESAATST